MLVINNCDESIRKMVENVYNFIINVFPSLKNKIVIIDFVEPEQIRSIKKQYWDMDSYTDTITLIFDDNVQIYLCLKIIYENCCMNSNSFERELYFVILHSFLHSLGMNEDEVRALQDDIFERFCKTAL